MPGNKVESPGFDQCSSTDSDSNLHIRAEGGQIQWRGHYSVDMLTCTLNCHKSELTHWPVPKTVSEHHAMVRCASSFSSKSLDNQFSDMHMRGQLYEPANILMKCMQHISGFI